MSAAAATVPAASNAAQNIGISASLRFRLAVGLRSTSLQGLTVTTSCLIAQVKIAEIEAAAEFAMEVLEPGWSFVAKVLAGGAEASLVAVLNRAFAKVQHVKPPASRKDSSEKYLVATGFRGPAGLRGRGRAFLFRSCVE